MVGHSEVILPRLATRFVSDPAEAFVRWVLVFLSHLYSRQTKYRDPNSRHTSVPVVIVSAVLFA